MKIELANRIRELPPYLFAHIDALKNEERKKGRDLIDLGIGDPDLPTHPHIVAALAEAARDPGTHRYPSYVGMEAFRKTAATFMKTRFGVKVDAQKEVVCASPPPSFLETPGAMEVGIEFHSLSKTYNMTGWRVGWACGNAQLVGGLGQVKSNVDSGCFDAVQHAAIAALSGDQAPVAR